MRRLTRIIVAFSLVLAGLGVTAAAAPQADEARAEHQRIVDFWTVDKVRQAIPRDFVLDAASGQFIPAAKGGKPGKPDGGGGGKTDVTGASWEDGGTVLRTTGKVLFALGGKYYVCSASVVNDTMTDKSLVLTAAHCVYENADTGEWAENWMFIPEWVTGDPILSKTDSNFCNDTAYGCWTAEALVVHDGFASAGGFNGTAVQYDFAFAVLGVGGKNDPTLVESLGTQTMSFTDVSKGTQVHAFGYPHAAPYDGNDLVYCAGGVNFDKRLANLTYKLGCDMTGGASGGPWGTEFGPEDGDGLLMSVNSYKYAGGKAMYGPKFNPTTKATYDAATSIDRDNLPYNIVVATGG